MKMDDVKPEAFLEGVRGVGAFTYEEMLDGLGWLGMSDDEVLMSISGVGSLAQGRLVAVKGRAGQVTGLAAKLKTMSTTQLTAMMAAAKAGKGYRDARPAQLRAALPAIVAELARRGVNGKSMGKPSVMNAIIGNAKEMNAKMAALAKARAAAAAKSPMFASALKQAKAKTAAPGTNEAKGIVEVMNAAAKKAMVAKQAEQKAQMLVKAGDKRAAAAQTINALTAAREATILANKAEKTRLTRSLDMTAETLEAQAKFLDGKVAQEAARTGQSMRTTAQAATAHNLRQQAQRLRHQSALVASRPDVPSNAPSQQRIADLANRFNVRTAAWSKFDRKKALVSVLSDLAEDPMAQTKDYDGALAYYGNDDFGRLMADIEFDNYNGAFAGLSQCVHTQMGYVDTLPILADADVALAQGQALARKAYASAVLPAAGLSGLGLHPKLFLESDEKFAARGPKWDSWCATTYAGDQDQINKCQNPGIGCDAIEPWSAAGKLCRGNTDIAGAAAQAGQAVISGKVKPPSLPGVPSGTKPAPQLPTLNPASIQQGLTSQSFQPSSYAQPSAGGIPTYVYAIGGVAVLGAAWMVFAPKRA